MKYEKLQILAELYRMLPKDHKPSIQANATVDVYLRGAPSLTTQDAQHLERYVGLLNELPDAAARARVIDCVAHEWCNDPGFVPNPDTEKTTETFMHKRNELGARLKGKEIETFYKIYGGVPFARFQR